MSAEVRPSRAATEVYEALSLELSEVKALAGLLEEVGDVQADESSFGVAAGSAALARVIIAKMELAEGHAQALLAGHRR